MHTVIMQYMFKIYFHKITITAYMKIKLKSVKLIIGNSPNPLLGFSISFLE